MAGKFYDELKIGEVFYSPKLNEPPIIVSEEDNRAFCKSTRNNQIIHFSDAAAQRRGFKRAIANSIYTMGLVVGATVDEITNETIVANVSYDKVAHPKPLYFGDQISVETEILSKRDSNSHSDQGIVRLRHVGKNQDGDVVIEIERTIIFEKKRISRKVFA